MKNSRFFYVVTILFLVSINIITVIETKKTRNNFRKTIDKLKESKERFENLSNIIKIRDSLSLVTEDIHINLNTVVKTLNNEDIYFNQILDKKPKLFFIFSDISCPPCVELEIDRLKEIAKIIGSENIILLASYRNVRHLKFLKQKKNLSVKMYCINDECLSLPKVMKNIPLLFILDSNENTKLIFIPEKTIPELSLQYYEIVRKRYFE